MKGYREWTQAEVILTKQLKAFEFVFFLGGFESCCGTLALKQQMRHFANILVSWWVIISNIFSVALSVKGARADLPSPLVHCSDKNSVLSWRMNRGCLEKKRAVLRQTPEIFPECALSSPHARIVPFVPLTHPSECRFTLKTNTEENLSEELTLWTQKRNVVTKHSWSITGSFRCFPRQIMKWSQISIQSCVRGQRKHSMSESWLNTPLALVWSDRNTDLSSEGSRFPGYTFSAGAACDGGCNCSPDCVLHFADAAKQP